MEIITSRFLGLDFSSQVLVAAIFTFLSLIVAVFALRSRKAPKSIASGCCCSCSTHNGTHPPPLEVEMNGQMSTQVVVERGSGASMMEQLVPEITTHTLSYLDYPSLCRLSMTNSLMRKAANDDNAWKALYHKVT